METYKVTKDGSSVTFEIQKDELTKKEIEGVYKAVIGEMNSHAEYNPEEGVSYTIKAGDPVIATELKEHFWKKTGIWRKGTVEKKKLGFEGKRIVKKKFAEYDFSIEV